MFIELTDHLRCPSDHPEAFLVLLPGRMAGRLVAEGVLGCPVCHREVALREGVADFGGGTAGAGPTSLTPEAAVALLGLSGPGGYLALIGAAGTLADGISDLVPGLRCIAVNPPADMTDSPAASVLRAGRLPLKRGSMRGAVIAADHAGDPTWLIDTSAAVLPGLRIIGEGEAPELPDLTLLATAGGWWVGRQAGARRG